MKYAWLMLAVIAVAAGIYFGHEATKTKHTCPASNPFCHR